MGCGPARQPSRGSGACRSLSPRRRRSEELRSGACPADCRRAETQRGGRQEAPATGPARLPFRLMTRPLSRRGGLDVRLSFCAPALALSMPNVTCRHALRRAQLLAFSGSDRKSTRPELQSLAYLVCRLLLEKKNNTQDAGITDLRSREMFC